MTYHLIKKGGLAQLARASALHAEGHRFDSDILHFFTSAAIASERGQGVNNDYRCYRQAVQMVQLHQHHDF